MDRLECFDFNVKKARNAETGITKDKDRCKKKVGSVILAWRTGFLRFSQGQVTIRPWPLDLLWVTRPVVEYLPFGGIPALRGAACVICATAIEAVCREVNPRPPKKEARNVETGYGGGMCTEKTIFLVKDN